MGKLKKYQTIDANEELMFHTHADVVGECFGVELNRNHQFGTWKNSDSSKWMVWFPKFLSDKLGNPMETDSGWINTASDDWNVIYEYTDLPDKEYVDGGFDENFHRLVFGYDQNEKNYCFRGVYVGSNDESRKNHHVFRRIATKVELIGEPIGSIRLVNPMKPWEAIEKDLNDEDNEIVEDVELFELTGDTREVVVKARINQGEFRNQLLNRFDTCRLCGVRHKELLVASHIKPWCKSEKEERTDLDNGLILCPNHDKLFDRGFISFDDDGRILISSELKDIERMFTNVNESMKISLSEKGMKYMKYHRENIYKK